MRVTTASELAKRRMEMASRRLGTKNPAEAIGGLLDRSFHLPAHDPRYGNNLLTPGRFPLEHSFSEVAGNALRLDMQPLGPEATAHARQQEASREMRRLTHQHYGKQALHWFDQRSERWRNGMSHGDTRFGAWFGMATDAYGLQECKVYYEMRESDIDNLPPNLKHAARIVMEIMPELTPIFTSIACGRGRGAQRVYFFHRGDLRLLDLEPLLNQLGIGKQLPSLLAAAGVIFGGRFVLPQGSVIIGLRDTNKGLEMKLDVLVAGLPDPPQQMYQLLNMVLSERPSSQSNLHRWVQAMTPDDMQGPGEIGVISVRVLPETPARCSLYLRPSGYDRQGRSAAGPGSAPQPQDAYRV
ncbi:MAG: hypothetical protein KZQ88_03550 [Candidatus Thiodiazotropha sp. (ex Dulcina madagascariensis)]|nr:hypothetical protein [Candidatus Thiodiazotropha sp. (ex Dulcina madagascariensis)]MCU7925934.1 hypothetical protein [Candidatus Thiodiazotropha sp. (ex Dulcina madagascariensis)]